MKLELFSISLVDDFWIDFFNVELFGWEGSLFFIYYTRWNGFDFDILFLRSLYCKLRDKND